MPFPNSWHFCDGDGKLNAPPKVSPSNATRRQILGAGFAVALSAWAERSALAQVSLHPNGGKSAAPDVLVTLFLRGGVDGLSVVVPHGDDDYYRARPTIGLAKPRDKRGNASGGVLDLDGFFGLHPVMDTLVPLYKDGLLGIVQAIGSQDQTRSHFEAMAAMERGVGNDAGREQNGWLARYLTAAPSANPSPLRAAAWSDTLPDSLRGASDVSVLRDISDFKLNFPAANNEQNDRMAQSLAALYGGKTAQTKGDAVTQAGRETLRVLDTIHRINPAHYAPENGATYPDSYLGSGFKQVACLIKAGVGLEAACLDRGGWDTHVAQGGTVGFLAEQLKDVSNSLAAFVRDMGNAKMQNVTVVVMTEFGRRVQENSGLGTDHGRASMMLVAGGAVHGGKVYGAWPGLAPAQLEGPGDLRVTTDYRTVLGEIVASRMAPDARQAKNIAQAVFPGAPNAPFLGMLRPRFSS